MCVARRTKFKVSNRRYNT